MQYKAISMKGAQHVWIATQLRVEGFWLRELKIAHHLSPGVDKQAKAEVHHVQNPKHNLHHYSGETKLQPGT
jgi:hypothetical protein